MPRLVLAALLLASPALGAPAFRDATEAAGLGGVSGPIARLCFVDLDADGWPDAVIDRHRVFMNRPAPDSPPGRKLVEAPRETTGLLAPVAGTVACFADLDNDGHIDAILAESIDATNPKWVDHGRRTRWQRGKGDGTFHPAAMLPTPPRTTTSIAVADVNNDGRLDLFFGNSYAQGIVGFPNDLLLSEGEGWKRQPLPDEGKPFDPQADAGGRPSYGVMILNNPAGPGPMLLELSYGRRWNRAWTRDGKGAWVDSAPAMGLDGDAVRHGKYPEWVKRQMDREDEPPFRANGNTFDAAVGDVDNDGRDDLFFSEITHAWAGESADRSRFLINQRDASGAVRFVSPERLSVDRFAPGDPNWNQGDLFCELADFDHDGRLDLALSSGDYPDNQRLRIFLQQPDGAFRDCTAALGIDHDGSQQISLADFDGDGDLDILVGQTFNRYGPEQIRGRTPHLKLLLNESTAGRKSVVLRLRGDGKAVSRDALGAMVEATARTSAGPLILRRQLIGIGGHAGKQHDFVVHLGLGDAPALDRLTITWRDGTEYKGVISQIIRYKNGL